jgi:hypothetical protein
MRVFLAFATLAAGGTLGKTEEDAGKTDEDDAKTETTEVESDEDEVKSKTTGVDPHVDAEDMHRVIEFEDDCKWLTLAWVLSAFLQCFAMGHKQKLVADGKLDATHAAENKTPLESFAQCVGNIVGVAIIVFIFNGKLFSSEENRPIWQIWWDDNGIYLWHLGGFCGFLLLTVLCQLCQCACVCCGLCCACCAFMGVHHGDQQYASPPEQEMA